LSAVFASSDSFTVAVDGPNTYRVNVIVPTPTPRLVDLREVVEIELTESNSQEGVKVAVLIPTQISLPIESQHEQFGNPFHLCAGDVPCSGGILAKMQHFYDSDGNGLADKIVLRFDISEVQSIWPASTIATPDPEGDLSEPTITEPAIFTVSGTFYGWQTAKE
jgi:hypothetical protein